METANLQIAIIGAGNMGGAIARGLAKGKLIQSKNIRVSDVSQANLDAIKAFDAEITVGTSNRDMIEGADIIMLAVKPWLVEVIAEEIENKINYEKQIIVLIAAGVDFGKMVELFDKQVIYEVENFNTFTAGATLLGRDIKSILGGNGETIQTFIRMLEDELKLEDESPLMNQIIETHKNIEFDIISEALNSLLQELKNNHEQRK